METKTMKTSPCLEGHRLVTGPRREMYGEVDEGFRLVAEMWSILLGQTITVQDVCRCMIALKLSRDVLVEKDDNLTDICGYVELAHMMRHKDDESTGS